MSAPRKLAYKGQPGETHTETAWLNARRWLQGETEQQAKGYLDAEISAGRVVVMETTA